MCWVPHSGASNVSEGYVVGHFDGDSSGKCRYLFMYVHEEGVTLPATHFSDGHWVNLVEMHGHGTTGSERVATDVVGCVSKGV